ncbi:Fibulin-1-like protein [Leptotrombidium deliense]|uniref:Fibulin-1-like protein n=1 Tax=Leptotrombidium deliense TaxID=299467 RepID=A0A443RZV9_9ACAR|nr:Fibulin-1-like protein [Leptotrombidium deliense]
MNRNGVCEDIDECIEDVCPDDKLCKNTPGSFVCNEDHENLVAFEKCSIGYFFNKHSNTCEDIDECQLEIDNCMEFGCENTIGSYKCIEQKCFPGFELINGVCEDINECQRLGVSACLPNETCINSKGLYFCQKCKQVETVYRCYSRKQCLLGYEPLQYQCVDVDECKIGLFDCTDEEQCVNTIPGYRCDCRPGYTRNRSNKKCEKSHSNCGMDNICPDLTQEFPCPIGYQLSVDKLKCEDIDECLYERCAEGETCVNLRGGHRCYIN